MLDMDGPEDTVLMKPASHKEHTLCDCSSMRTQRSHPQRQEVDGGCQVKQFPYDQAIPLLVVYPGELGTCSHKTLPLRVHRASITTANDGESITDERISI